MDNKAHIWLVNAHSKSNCCNYDMVCPFLPLFLNSRSILWLHAGVVMVCLDMMLISQLPRNLLTALPRKAIYDPRHVPVLLLNSLGNAAQYVFAFSPDFVG